MRRRHTGPPPLIIARCALTCSELHAWWLSCMTCECSRFKSLCCLRAAYTQSVSCTRQSPQWASTRPLLRVRVEITTRSQNYEHVGESQPVRIVTRSHDISTCRGTQAGRQAGRTSAASRSSRSCCSRRASICAPRRPNGRIRHSEAARQRGSGRGSHRRVR
eukprot:COSAG01_NODE_733_length_13988_cov_1136.208150_8_plen_162_part_00